jgi:uroporphyrinogen-III decarboxylase
MNERERLVRTLTCSTPDRPSYGDYFAYDSTRLRWEREGLPAGLDTGGLFRYFEMDHTDIWGGDGLFLSPRPIPQYQEEIFEDTEYYILQRNAGGSIIRTLKNTPPPAMPQFVGHPVTDRKSWQDLMRRLDPDSPGRLPANLEEIGRLSPNRTTPFGAWLGGTYGYIRDWLGVKGASYALYDDPSWIEEMIAYLTHFYATLARKIFAAGVQLDWVMFWEDIAYKAGPLISPKLYCKYCIPFYQTLIDIVHQNGTRVIGLDSDGDIAALIPIWLDLGINVMHPMEVASGMDVRETRLKYGTKVSFIGGIDKRQLALDRAAIDAEVIPKVRKLLESGGGFVVEVDHGIPPDISFDNYCYFRDLVRSLCEG